MPQQVLERAGEMLRQLEESHTAEGLGQHGAGKGKRSSRPFRIPDKDAGYQLSFIQLDDPLLQQIKEDILNTEINTLTPVEALMKLNEIKKLLKKN